MQGVLEVTRTFKRKKFYGQADRPISKAPLSVLTLTRASYQPDRLSGVSWEISSCGRLPAYMLSAVIRSGHSYPAVPLARQLVH